MTDETDESVCACQSVERGGGSQVDHAGPQRQARRPGVDAGRTKQTRELWRKQLCSGKNGQETFASKEMSGV